MNIYFIITYLTVGVIFASIVVFRGMLWDIFGYRWFEIFLRIVGWPVFLIARLYNLVRYGEFK